MIFKIFKKDLKGLSRNILALAIALGLCLIPSLYAWFNIYSNWDPYANTASVQIAIVTCMDTRLVELIPAHLKVKIDTVHIMLK